MNDCNNLPRRSAATKGQTNRRNPPGGGGAAAVAVSADATGVGTDQAGVKYDLLFADAGQLARDPDCAVSPVIISATPAVVDASGNIPETSGSLTNIFWEGAGEGDSNFPAGGAGQLCFVQSVNHTYATAPATLVVQVPASIAPTGGTPQATNQNTAFGIPFAACVRDAAGNPVNGAPVTFRAPSFGASGTFSGGATTAVASTAGNCVATAPAFTTNSSSGGFSVVASVPGVTATASFNLINQDSRGCVCGGGGSAASASGHTGEIWFSTTSGGTSRPGYSSFNNSAIAWMQGEGIEFTHTQITLRYVSGLGQSVSCETSSATFGTATTNAWGDFGPVQVTMPSGVSSWTACATIAYQTGGSLPRNFATT